MEGRAEFGPRPGAAELRLLLLLLTHLLAALLLTVGCRRGGQQRHKGRVSALAGVL